ncbi:MAG: proton-conducting transporter membrane subunit [Pseudomonadota bacterium]
MIHLLLPLPIAAPILLAAIAFLLRARLSAQRGCAFVGAAIVGVSGLALLDANLRDGIQVTAIADHPAPFGIVLVADVLSALMTLVNGIVGVAVVLYRDREAESQPVFHPLLLALLAGTSGAFLTGDLFNFYVWFEIAVAASLGLLVLGGRPEQIDAGIKYAVLNVFAASALLFGIGLVYAGAGTLNFADLARSLPELSDSGLLLGMAVTLLVALGCKAAVFPLYFWLPASYHTGAFAVGAILSGLLTKIGVYALYRVFLIVFPAQLAELRAVFFALAALTMVTGVLGAAAQTEIRRILAFHVISQVGYLVFGLALLSPFGIAGGIFYMVHVIVVKANLFLVGGLAYRLLGTSELGRMGGLVRDAPGSALLFAISAAAIAGIPPLSGFWAKLFVVYAGIQQRAYWLSALALAVGVLTLYSMTKIWQLAFWGASAEAGMRESVREVRPAYLPAALLTLGILAIGVYPRSVLYVAERAAAQLIERAGYVDAVTRGR